MPNTKRPAGERAFSIAAGPSQVAAGASEGCFYGEANDYICSDSGRYSFWQLDDSSEPALRCELSGSSSLDAGISGEP